MLLSPLTSSFLKLRSDLLKCKVYQPFQQLELGPNWRELKYKPACLNVTQCSLCLQPHINITIALVSQRNWAVYLMALRFLDRTLSSCTAFSSKSSSSERIFSASSLFPACSAISYHINNRLHKLNTTCKTLIETCKTPDPHKPSIASSDSSSVRSWKAFF